MNWLRKGGQDRLPSIKASRLLSEFELVQVLGTGSFGVVVKVKSSLDKKTYAVKVASPSQGSHNLREVQNLAKVPTHKNVVMYFTCWQDSLGKDELENVKRSLGIPASDKKFSLLAGQTSIDILCIQMELCGQDMRVWLGKQRLVNEKTNVDIFLQICAGLEHIHKQDLIHRDLKPENIFFSATDPSTIKIGDLGIATNHVPIVSALHTFGAGTPLYLAPEQGSTKYGKTADMYSLGLLLFELFDPSLQPSVNKGSYEPLLQGFKVLKFNSSLPAPITAKWPKVAKLILRLVSVEPRARPNFVTIYDTFNNSNPPTKLSLPMPLLKPSKPAPLLAPKATPKPAVAVVIEKDGCGFCGKSIVGKVTTAMGQRWHEQHFCCNHCHKPLKTFFEKNGQPYCKEDFHNLFSPRCEGCKKPIESECLTVGGVSWHQQHFCCVHCRKPIGAAKFYDHHGKVYCAVDYMNCIAPKCRGCHKAIESNHILIEEQPWHNHCFICSVCRKPIGAGSYKSSKNNVPICLGCSAKI